MNFFYLQFFYHYFHIMQTQLRNILYVNLYDKSFTANIKLMIYIGKNKKMLWIFELLWRQKLAAAFMVQDKDSIFHMSGCENKKINICTLQNTRENIHGDYFCSWKGGIQSRVFQTIHISLKLKTISHTFRERVAIEFLYTKVVLYIKPLFYII